MSDEVPPIQGARIRSADSGLVARLATKAARLKSLVDSLTAERDTAAAEAKRLAAENQSLSQRADTSASAKRALELETELRGMKHRQVFDRIAAAEKARPEAIEDLWQLSGYQAEGDAADENVIKQLIGEQRSKRGYLFQPPDGSAPPDAAEPPRPGPGSGKAPPATAPGKFTYTKSDLNNTYWQMQNGAKLREAFASGTAVLIPET